MIAQQAIQLDVPLFSLDRHFALMAQHTSLRIWPRSIVKETR